MKPVSRREIIKTFFLGTAFSNLAGHSWAAPVLFDLQAVSQNQTGLLLVKLGDFPELNAAQGSVRIGTSALVPAEAGGQRHSGLFAPVLINRGNADDFYVMSAECSHEGCTVRKLDPATEMINCSCLPPVHGSQYRIDGTVVRGPARQPLQAYSFIRKGDTIEIQIPNSFYEMKMERVAAGGRVQVSFLGFVSIVYEIYFRPSLSAPAEKVSFSLSANGALDQVEMAGRDDFANVYLDRPGSFGFFQIAMKTRTL